MSNGGYHKYFAPQLLTLLVFEPCQSGQAMRYLYKLRWSRFGGHECVLVLCTFLSCCQSLCCLRSVIVSSFQYLRTLVAQRRVPAHPVVVAFKVPEGHTARL